MCLATVYLEKEGEKEEVMQDVAWIKPQSTGLQLITFMGESKLFEAEIKHIDLANSSIVLELLAPDSSQMLSEDEQD